jgi:hypothetical protein
MLSGASGGPFLPHAAAQATSSVAAIRRAGRLRGDAASAGQEGVVLGKVYKM